MRLNMIAAFFGLMVALMLPAPVEAHGRRFVNQAVVVDGFGRATVFSSGGFHSSAVVVQSGGHRFRTFRTQSVIVPSRRVVRPVIVNIDD